VIDPRSRSPPRPVRARHHPGELIVRSLPRPPPRGLFILPGTVGV
jgi:hypothetical protein